jgi:signal transduction histidine kinase
VAFTEASREHELRNQLTIILGFSELLARSIPATDPRHEDVTTIRQAASTALDLLHDAGHRGGSTAVGPRR